MGAYLSKPVTEKISSDESSEFLSCGASSMQGWRIDQEDAHNTCLRYDKNRSFFAVYDGHGGSEVATYTASELPDFIKKLETYKNEQFSQALIDAFLEFDATLVESDTQAILKQLAGAKDQEQEDSDYDGEEVDHLCREASMPLEEVMAKYSDDCTMHFQSPNIRQKKIGCSFSSAGCSSSFNESSEQEDLECNSLESSCSHLDESNRSKIDESCESSEEDTSLSKTSGKSCPHIEEATSSLCNGTSEKLNKEGESSKVEKSDDSCNGSTAELDKEGQSCKSEEKPDSLKLGIQELPKIENVEHASLKNKEIISNNLNLKEISSKITNEEPSKLCKEDKEEIVSKTDKEILSPEESKEELLVHSEKETKPDNKSTLNGDGGSPLVNGKIKDEGGGKIDCDEKMNEGEDSSSQSSEKMDVEIANNKKNCKENGDMPQLLDAPTGKGKGGKAKGKGLINNSLIHAMKVVRQEKKRMAAVAAEKMYKQIRVARDDSSSEDDEEDEDDENFESNLCSHNVEEGSSDEEEGESDNEEEDGVEGDDDEEEEEEDDDDDDEEEEDENNRGGVQYSEFPMNMREEPGYDSGCTACVAFLNGHELYVANVGDSRCVVCRNGKALDMSIDHKPEDEPEAARIFQAGGRITGDGRVNGGLNLSRALGDHSYKQNKTQRPEAQMISPLPDVRSLTLTPEDTFMVIACDGIWNSMSSQEAIDFINERLETHPKLSKIAEAMFDHCLSPDVHGDGTGCDNMTCIIIKFKSSWLSTSEGAKRSCDVTDPDTEVSDPQEKRCRVEAE